MKYLILLTLFVVAAFGYNPAMMTSNTYPGSNGYQNQYASNSYPGSNGYQNQYDSNSYPGSNSGYQTQYQNPSQPMQYQDQQGGYQTQSNQGYRRPNYQNGMMSPVNYTPYLQTRGAPMFPRSLNPQEQEMSILPYPSQYTNRNDNQGFNNGQNQGRAQQPNTL